MSTDTERKGGFGEGVRIPLKCTMRWYKQLFCVALILAFEDTFRTRGCRSKNLFV